MKHVAWVVTWWTALLISTCTFANDSIARVGAGGLELLKSDKIRMVSEVLEISTSTVRVKYHFLNTSTNDINATVAFPMPTYGFNPGFSESMSNVGPFTSISEFSIKADGKDIKPKFESRAKYGDRDITEDLRRIGLSDAQIFQTFGDCKEGEGETIVCGLSNSQEEAISKLNGAKNKHGYLTGWQARWEIAETAYWEQLFPGGKDIEVEHEYEPLVGSSYDYSEAFIDAKKTAEGCIDESTRKAISKQVQNAGGKVITLSEVEYILGTGRNWKGAIKNFKLIIRKEYPSQIVSLCFPGSPKKTSPLTFEFSQANFVPQDKLVVYFFTVAKEVAIPKNLQQ